MDRSKERLSKTDIDVYIFDMDGTTYQLDGIDNGFHGSLLEKSIRANLVSFVALTESIDPVAADEIVSEVERKGFQFSYFFSERYTISRTQFFEVVWDIDPAGLVREYDKAVQTIKQLAAQGKTLILLTSAPSVWAKRVCSFLNITADFSGIYTGDSFNEKSEVFIKLIEGLDPTRTISIGDQLTTEIEPAQKLGMKTLHVKHPDELGLLLTENI